MPVYRQHHQCDCGRVVSTSFIKIRGGGRSPWCFSCLAVGADVTIAALKQSAMDQRRDSDTVKWRQEQT